MTISSELTFIPRKAPHEILSKKQGEGPKILNGFATIAAKIYRKYGVLVQGKLDPHRNACMDGETYCLEVVPMSPSCWETYWFTDKGSWKVLKAVLDEIFKGASSLGLAPIVSTKNRKTGAIKDWPGGGCHLHCGINFMHGGSDWYKRMEEFHRSLIVDYAYRPYIRWLFKQWFADSGGTALISENSPAKDFRPKNLFERVFYGGSEIEARFMGTSKACYPTFELRMFSMVANPQELKAIAIFADRWMRKIRAGGQSKEELLIDESSKLPQLKNLRKARSIITNFLDELDLSWDDYASFFERNYVKRVKFGKLI